MVFLPIFIYDGQTDDPGIIDRVIEPGSRILHPPVSLPAIREGISQFPPSKATFCT
jgi:hypothetical protein